MNDQPRVGDATPPRWAERFLRLFLARRDRESITGDLLEEYREAILPTRSRFRAQMWYVGQALSLIDGVAFGIAIGTLLGAWILVDTVVSPLADDTALGVGGMFGGVFLLLGIPGFLARSRGGHFADAIRAGAIAGAITFALFLLVGILRVNLFLDTIRDRSDWQNLVADFGRSGFQSLRAYANYVYAKQIVVIPAIGTIAGVISGAIGGLLGGLGRRSAA
jgi:hypothetical protein